MRMHKVNQIAKVIIPIILKIVCLFQLEKANQLLKILHRLYVLHHKSISNQEVKLELLKHKISLLLPRRIHFQGTKRNQKNQSKMKSKIFHYYYKMNERNQRVEALRTILLLGLGTLDLDLHFTSNSITNKHQIIPQSLKNQVKLAAA